MKVGDRSYKPAVHAQDVAIAVNLDAVDNPIVIKVALECAGVHARREGRMESR